ncbi:hypothetical protein [Nostoc sp. UHCC 0252]|uniref:hypothetical protein n=1 Tax=Nostoc sp. UHCC 0252 TaxID=3110241 RepID=UPI002B212FB6|nr:hypothetical protein [Nostoc sp. UHCC 0252]MEA5605747.1 hypothetical protein [Nostoc sp. UHCC 0252]
MKIPLDAIIADEKITRYLLVPREQDDKSKFLALAGFTQDNPELLKAAIRQLADSGVVKGIVKYKKSNFLVKSSAGSDKLSTSTRAIAGVNEQSSRNLR